MNKHRNHNILKYQCLRRDYYLKLINMEEISDKQHLNLLKQYKGIDRRYRLRVTELHRLYRSFNSTPIGLTRFSKMLSDATKQKNPLIILKYLILIHGTIQYNYYSESYLESLLEFNIHPQTDATDKMQEWLLQVVMGYFKYISKISFHGDIYQRSLTLKFKPQEAMVDLFMILNQLNSYCHQVKGVFNCAGRYYFQKLFQMQDFFDILQNQFTNLYLLLRAIIQHIIQKDTDYENEELQSFVESFQELDNINDSLQDLLRNKHYQKPLRFQFMQLSKQDQINILNLIMMRENNTQKILQ